MNQIDISCHYGENLKIGHFNVIGKNNLIRENVTICNNCTIYENTTISNDVFLGSNIVVGVGCLIGNGAEISSGCLIDDGVSIGQYAQLSLGEKVLEDILPFAQFKGGKIVGVNLRAIADNAKNLKIDDVEYMQAEAWRVIEYISTHPLSYAHKVKEELKKAQNVPDGKLLQIICEFDLSQRNGRNLAKAAPL